MKFSTLVELWRFEFTYIEYYSVDISVGNWHELVSKLR